MDQWPGTTRIYPRKNEHFQLFALTHLLLLIQLMDDPIFKHKLVDYLHALNNVVIMHANQFAYHKENNIHLGCGVSVIN